jgi:hypothetical protein
MKTTVKIFHLLWVVYFSFIFLGRVSFSYAPGGGLKMDCFEYSDPYDPLFTILALIWLCFGIGLFFGRVWIWLGCVVFTLSSLAYESLALLISYGIPVHHVVFWDLLNFCLAGLVAEFLLLTWREFRRKHVKAA